MGSGDDSHTKNSDRLAAIEGPDSWRRHRHGSLLCSTSFPVYSRGYLYQRRWKAYWVTSALATAWTYRRAVLAQDADAAMELQNQLVGLIGLLGLAVGTATEAVIAACVRELHFVSTPEIERNFGFPL